MTFRLFKSGELHETALDMPLFLVQPIIPAGGLVMLHGPKTAGKTQLALTLGCAVASGQPFLGEYPCVQGGVVLLEVDMPLPLLQSRVQMSEETRQLWFVHAEPFDIVRVARTEPLPSVLKEVQAFAPALLIVDSLRKTYVGEENDSATPSRVYAAWQHLFPRTCLAFMHHDRKKPTDPDAWLHPEEAARGTGAWLDDADTGLHLDKIRGSKHGGHVATLTFSKCRTTEEPPPMVVRMRDDSLLLEPTKPTTKQRLVAWRRDHPEATHEEARQWLMSDGACSRATAFRVLAEVGL